MPHISAHLSCISVPTISASQCHLYVMPCCLSVPPISAIYEYCLSVPIRDVCQCPPVMPVNAHQCHLPVPSH
ncbi:unnamed protein product [Staurois parvus]|uniref:Uncharacterized protein n=1 Tax=Staurois parvus TaxID=386267 RepID=A0ABN9GBI7_9NEOB|nr:unnamed protein product [Staurois parvus]